MAAQGVDRRTARTVGRARCSRRDRKSTRLNSSHDQISYAVSCLKKKITELGFEPELTREGQDLPIRLHACPFRAVAAEYPEVLFLMDMATTGSYTLSLHAALPI